MPYDFDEKMTGAKVLSILKEKDKTRINNSTS